jgi:hypothetical protein
MKLAGKITPKMINSFFFKFCYLVHKQVAFRASPAFFGFSGAIAWGLLKAVLSLKSRPKYKSKSSPLEKQGLISAPVWGIIFFIHTCCFNKKSLRENKNSS